jgi:HK97 family phage major capsid protein
MSLKEKKQTLKALVAEAKKMQADASSDESKTTAEAVAAIDSKLEAIKELKSEIEREETISDADGFLNAPSQAKSGFAPAIVNDRKPTSLGSAFTDSEGYKSAVTGVRRQGTQVAVDLPDFNPSLKTVFTTAGSGLNGATQYIGNNGEVVMLEQQRLTVADLLAKGTTTLNSVPFIKESTFDNAADIVGEGNLKPEATFVTEEASAPVKKIAVVGRVTDELFNDFPAMQSYVDNRLRYMVGAKEEDQILNGAGSGEITGILNTSGILTQPLGTDSAADALHKGITKVRSTGFFEPDGIIMHPDDWQQLRLAKNGDDDYYAGGPFTALSGNSIWGLPVVVTTSIATGTALVGSFRLGAQIFYREGISVEASNSDGDDFSYNRMAIRVEERMALAVYRPAAFCAVSVIAEEPEVEG